MKRDLYSIIFHGVMGTLWLLLFLFSPEDSQIYYTALTCSMIWYATV